MTDTEPLPAADIDAERTLLATAMHNPAVLDLVPVSDYYLPAHEAIHEALRRLYAAGANTTVPDLVRELGTDAVKVDDRVKLLTLADPALIAADPGYYADIVREKAAQRQFVAVLTRARQRAVVNGVPVAELRAGLDADLAGLDRPGGGPVSADVGQAYPSLDWSTVWSQAQDEIAWLAEPILERGRLYSMFSRAGVGKSLLLLEICAALASGRPVLGNPARDPVTVLYVDLENAATDLVERLSAFGYRPDDLNRLRYLSFPSLPALDSPTGGRHLVDAVAHYRAEVVVIDTVSRVVAGNENDSDTYHALYRCALAPLKAQGITVIRLDHAGKDTERGQRGSSAKDSDVDVVWQLEQITAVAFRLTRGKHRNNHHPERVDLERQFSPLRHRITRETGIDPAVDEVIDHLDRLGVPRDAGRDACRKALTGDRIQASNANISAAVRERKTCPGQVGG